MTTSAKDFASKKSRTNRTALFGDDRLRDVSFDNDVMCFRYNLDNTIDGLYIAPAFMDKLVVHVTKNFMTLPNIKVK